ncbi:hypothetical protein BU23DRAFT_160005 [Bimuria novae-zelandiae CBS 107.79]|uniref:Endonuclease/exonuclease/phosphatase domain-containing protein n=1 Tax=Bimuria novae-zelandiae CBS 107.79 TaxID=1447943 RepID=A0A6A5V4Z3_9PLEO|nr:hypothetical protein BU23DRAFT_160005 [Bimuria novae-zelandiae CBS 107.79]
MNSLIQRAIAASARLQKPTVSWAPDSPSPQPYHVFDTTTSSWVSKTPAKTPDTPVQSPIKGIALYTWNIDFMLPSASARMAAALSHLHTLISAHFSPSPDTAAPIIFLQECTPEDLEVIASTPWVRQRFALTDISPTHWSTTHYGTTILLSLRLPITALFRVHFAQTRMDRDALFADLAFPSRSGNKTTTIRLCNTHLESLALSPPLRPAQMALIARYLYSNEAHAGLAAGDFNAIQPFDRTLHSDNNLKDAFLEQGGEEDTEEAYTWGQQAATALRETFGCSRMDKVFFTGGLKLVEFRRFGEDVQIPGGSEEERRTREEIVKLGFEKAWVTDHLGVLARFEVV